MKRITIAVALVTSLIGGAGSVWGALARTAASPHSIAAPTPTASDPRVVIYLHAFNETTASPDRPDLLAAVEAAGYVLVRDVGAGAQSWDDPDAIARLNVAADTYAPNGQRVRLLCESMGCALGLRWAERHPDRVAALVGLQAVTRWDSSAWVAAAVGHRPPLPSRVSYPAAFFASSQDLIAGVPRIDGAEVRAFEAGNHNAMSVLYPVADMVAALG